MSVWNKDNCIITIKGNQALTEIASKGGTMTFDSVWTCSERVDPTALYELEDLPNKKQQMTLVKYSQVSSGYTINVQVTNEGLTVPYAIEMVGVYMKLKGFNDGNPFLYMVLLTDEGSADQMTNISKSTYKYAIYLYHTNKAVLNISLSSSDYVSADTFEHYTQDMESKISRLVYNIDFTDSRTETTPEKYLKLYTENFETNPFRISTDGDITAYPTILIHNYTGFLTNDGYDIVGEVEANSGIFIDDVGPFELVPFADNAPNTNHLFSGETLMCSLLNGNSIRVNNFYDDTSYLTKYDEVYSNFNELPLLDGIYTLLGNAENSPITLTPEYVWTCLIVKSVNAFIAIAVNNANDYIYRRWISADDDTWQKSYEWTSIGGSGSDGLKKAQATFTDYSSEQESTTTPYIRLSLEDDDSEDIPDGAILSVTRTNDSVSLSGVSIFNSKWSIGKKSLPLFQSDGKSSVPVPQLPKHFLLKKVGATFILLTPTATPIFRYSTDAPNTTSGVPGTLWIRYYDVE